ncbi:MAG: hypothetical protein KDD55_11795 [Bdellovibrionales bacterium]|nr:hypothetical protein [Bdellovibrionales bacterium]
MKGNTLLLTLFAVGAGCLYTQLPPFHSSKGERAFVQQPKVALATKDSESVDQRLPKSQVSQVHDKPRKKEAMTTALSAEEEGTLRELNGLAVELVETYDDSDPVSAEIPGDLRKKLENLSPQLLTLVELAVQIPPRKPK